MLKEQNPWRKKAEVSAALMEKRKRPRARMRPKRLKLAATLR